MTDQPQPLDRIAHSLEQITREKALEACGLRIYETEYLHALEQLGITIV